MGSPEKPIDVEMGDMSEEAKLNPNVEKSEQLKENGDVKEERFTGLKKEDLLKISSQPKWVRARWVLFILFWIIWVAMLVGAILIVVNAPRCKPEPTPQWYQDAVAYEVNAEQFAGGLEGAKDHLPYIEGNLHAKTILLTGASKQIDPAATINDTQFKSLVEAIHAIDESHIVVDIVVDSLPVSSSVFAESSSSDCASGNSGNNCDLFVWQAGNETVVPDGWLYNRNRNAQYRYTRTTEGIRAFINYGNDGAITYMLDVIQSWFARGVDGIKIRDLANLHNFEPKDFIQTIWNDTFQNDSSRALYVYSSSPDVMDTPVVLEVNDTNTAHSPVFLNAKLPEVVNQNEAGWKIQNVIEEWREKSRNIPGFVVTPVGNGLAATEYGGLAAGLNLLSMSLPGVPILRSGDELAAKSPVFAWKEGKLRDSVPLNGSQTIMQQTKELIVRRVAGIQAQPSLRYDTRDNDTTFKFLAVATETPEGEKDIVAFVRKWDKKKAVLVVSNMSPNNHTVNLVMEGGLMTDKKPSKKAKVVVTSGPYSDAKDPIKLESVKLDTGTTLVLQNP